MLEDQGLDVLARGHCVTAPFEANPQGRTGKNVVSAREGYRRRLLFLGKPCCNRAP